MGLSLTVEDKKEDEDGCPNVVCLLSSSPGGTLNRDPSTASAFVGVGKAVDGAFLDGDATGDSAAAGTLKVESGAELEENKGSWSHGRSSFRG